MLRHRARCGDRRQVRPAGRLGRRLGRRGGCGSLLVVYARCRARCWMRRLAASPPCWGRGRRLGWRGRRGASPLAAFFPPRRTQELRTAPVSAYYPYL